MGKNLKIIYRSGETKEHYVDDYGIRDGCLYYYIRFGIDRGIYNIPLDLIEEWSVH